MSAENELYDVLSAEIGTVPEEEMAAAVDGLPMGMSTFMTLVVAFLKKYGCEYKDAAVEQVNKYIDAWVSNVMWAAMAKLVVRTAVKALCGE